MTRHGMPFSVLLAVGFFLISYATSEPQSIIEEPSDQQAKIGEQALLKCQIKNLKGEPQWCIDDFCLGLSKKDNGDNSGSQLTLKGRPRHRIVGDKSKGEFNLLIDPVQLQDNMYYYCMVTAASETVKAVKSNKAFLTVLTHPQSLVLDNPVHVSLNKPSTIHCVAKQSRPPVKILVAINGRLITDESKYKTEIMQAPNPINGEHRPILISSFSQISVEQLRQSFYDTITNLTVDDVTMRMHGQSVECFSYSFPTGQFPSIQSNPSLSPNDVMSIKSFIQVDYAPEVNLKIVSGSRVLKEEEVISLVCETRATPSIQSYKWYIGQNYLSGVGDSNLNLKLRREMHLQTVTCEASNTVASVKASIQLSILFKPWFLKGPRSFMLIGKNACNKPLTLDCQVIANPGANITWYRRRFTRKNSLNPNHGQETNTEIGIYDEMIGTGPTYTIASFNCANALAYVRNRTKLVKPRSGMRKHVHHKKEKDRFISKRDVLTEMVEDSMDYAEQDEYELDEDSGGEVGQVDFEKTSIGNDFDDFGVYMCEAANKLSSQSTRRFIKLNPVGPPLVRAFSSSPVSADEAINTLMKTPSLSFSTMEIAASLGSSVSLFCLIEPLPHFESIVWLRENGIVIPNSRYSSKYSESRSSSLTTISNIHRVRNMRNFKIKYENLTGSNGNGEENVMKMSNSMNPDGVLVSNVDIGLMRSILYIKSLRRQDLGLYKCKSSNFFGSRSVSVLIREKTIMDKINLDNYMIFTVCVVGLAAVFFLVVLILVCLISSRSRLSQSDKISRDKDLLSQNLNCEQSSDKTINEWLTSSKLSNDTATGSLVNAPANNPSTTTTIAIHEHPCALNFHNSVSKNSKINKLLSSPGQLRQELAGNCSSLLNDDLEDEMGSETTGDKKDEISNFNNKRDDSRSYQNSNFSRFLISSPLLSDCADGQEKKELTSDEPNKIQIPPMMVIRSQNYGNFNNKNTGEDHSQRLLTCVPSSLDISPKRSNQKRTFNSYSLTRSNEKILEKEYYENSNMSSQENQEELNKILQDTTYRLSDLFNDLSPNLPQNPSQNNKTNNLLQNNLSSKASNNHNTLPHSTFIQSPKMPSFQQENAPLRQALLQTIVPNGSNPPNSTFNKFPNPYKKPVQSTISSNTSKFYTNFYRNPNLSASNEQYGINIEDNKQNQASFDSESGIPFAKIVTTSSANGSNKYLTVI